MTWPQSGNFLAPLLITVWLTTSGCVQTRVTEPTRTGVEQLLLAAATEQALEAGDFAIFYGKKVFVDGSYFEAYDKQYALGALRNSLSKGGALLAKDAESADIIIEPRAAALSTDSAKALIGLPATGLPLPMAGSVNTPEFALYKSERQFGIAKIALFAFERENRSHYNSQGPWIGKSHHHYFTFLGYFKYTSTSLPETKRPFWKRNKR